MDVVLSMLESSPTTSLNKVKITFDTLTRILLAQCDSAKVQFRLVQNLPKNARSDIAISTMETSRSIFELIQWTLHSRVTINNNRYHVIGK